ncbi:hypothetical protein COCON_G00225530 [Conger conger]|uniref:Uncharacterized protein n=1 Tax=Conger conger TaxID=82655 RepID=A0A9Q1CWW7_CONCO|nr:hypothetical protein COCON_G00225530 [Conger conger]
MSVYRWGSTAWNGKSAQWGQVAAMHETQLMWNSFIDRSDSSTVIAGEPCGERGSASSLEWSEESLLCDETSQRKLIRIRCALPLRLQLPQRSPAPAPLDASPAPAAITTPAAITAPVAITTPSAITAPAPPEIACSCPSGRLSHSRATG